MTKPDPIDRLDKASARLRQVASDLYSADVDEITQKTEVHVHVTQPSQPDGRISDLPQVPAASGWRPVIVALGGIATAALTVAKAFGWL